MLELAADLRLLDEPPDQLGPVAVLLQEDLHGEVAAQVDVAALEDGAHAAAGDLAEELQPAGGGGNPGRGRTDDRRRVILGDRVAEQDAREAADRLRQRRRRVRRSTVNRRRCDAVSMRRHQDRRPVEPVAERLEEGARFLVGAKQGGNPPAPRRS